MLNFPNFLSLMRIPLAILFLKQNILLRSCIIVTAMLTDGLDGYMARRYQSSTKLGTLLDPLTDKFFVLSVLGILLLENRLSLLEACAFLCRDFSLVIFGFYLFFTGNLGKYKFRSIWCGKLTTCLQFAILLGLTLQISISPYFYGFFILLGLCALVELSLPTIIKEEG